MGLGIQLINNSPDDADRAYQEQKAARQLNINKLDRESSRRTHFAKFTLLLLALFGLALISGLVRGAWEVLAVSGCCLVVAVALLVRFTRQIARLRKMQRQIFDVETTVQAQRKSARRQREGIRPRNERDVIVEPTEWNKSNHVRTDWIEGQTKSLLPGDVVLKWDHHVQRGLCLQRHGKIIANRVLMYISW
jgi:hypothetical protein